MRLAKQRLAVSPVIATLLLIAIAVAAGIVLYIFVSGLTTSLSNVKGTVTQPLQLTITSVTKSTGGGSTVWQISFIVINPNGAGVTLTNGIITDNNGVQQQTIAAFATTSTTGACPTTSTTASVSATTQTIITACFSSITGLNSGNTYRLVIVGSDAVGNQYSSNPAPFTLR
jgi:FlaG/FlaF family flagellin (archaellin)